MKIQKTRSRSSGFTLVELLVVIAIIAVLASVGFGVANSALSRAKRMKALTICVGVDTAVNNFYSEYNTMPLGTTAGTNDELKNTSRDTAFLNILLGTDETNNPRKIRFLEVAEAKNRLGGLIYGAQGTADSLVDPWGGPFFVMLDGDYDEKLEVSPTGDEKTLNGRRVATWSNGADAAPSGSGGKKTDNVTSW